jgi:hypothetical protein
MKLNKNYSFSNRMQGANKSSQFYQTFPLTNFIKDNEKIKAPIFDEDDNLVVNDYIDEVE